MKTNKFYKLSEDVFNRVNSVEELGEEVLFLSHKKLWSVNCNERSIETEAINDNHINIYDFGTEEFTFVGCYDNPTEYINVPVNQNQLKEVM